MWSQRLAGAIRVAPTPAFVATTLVSALGLAASPVGAIQNSEPGQVGAFEERLKLNGAAPPGDAVWPRVQPQLQTSGQHELSVVVDESRSIAERVNARSHGLLPLYYALTFVTGLTPDALEPPPTVDYPAIRRIAHPLVNAADLAMTLKQPIVSSGCGRVMLAEIDRRLGGFAVSLEALQILAEDRALVGIGVVRTERTASGGASTADLWTFARAALAQRSVMHVRLGGIGQDAFLAVHDRVTQVAWLRDDRLLTVSVTSVAGQQLWMIRMARSIATFVDDRLGVQDKLDHPIPA